MQKLFRGDDAPRLVTKLALPQACCASGENARGGSIAEGTTLLRLLF
jgi:hypothetical protein